MFRFIKDLKSNILNNNPLKEAIIFSTDTKELFADIDGNRIQISDIVSVDTITNLNNILAPISNKFYYVEETNCLYRYINSEWVIVGGRESDITEDDISNIVDSMEL